MERETVEGLRLGTTLIFISAVLVVGLLVFWYARTYSNLFFEDAAQQNIAMKTAELSGLEVAGETDMPLASLYSILSREWRAVSEIRVFDKDGGHIVTASAQGDKWALLDVDGNPITLTKVAGADVTGTLQINKLSGPEQVLYAMEGRRYSNRLSGRGYVTVTQIESTMTYSILVRLQQ